MGVGVKGARGFVFKLVTNICKIENSRRIFLRSWRREKNNNNNNNKKTLALS